MHKIIFNKLLANWGATKLVQVIMGACICGSIGGVLLITFVPNEPTQIKENENE